MTLRVLLIGASGVFGSRIASELAHAPRFALTLAGQRLAGLQALRERLNDGSIQLMTFDVRSAQLSDVFAPLQTQLVIHAFGQGKSQWISAKSGRDRISVEAQFRNARSC